MLEPFGNPGGGYDAFEVVTLGGRHIAFYNENNARGTYFVHPNALGSDSNTTDYGGNANGEQIYAPFGQELVSGGQGIRFAGMSHRDQTGFDVTPARDYSSTMGRWLTPDPGGLKAVHLADPQTWNMYAYVSNNPTTRVDPSGLNWFEVNGQWEWHKGKKYTDDEGNVFTSNYTHLLEVTPSGTNQQGAATYKLTLYDQNKVVGKPVDAFSGGNGLLSIRSGNYTIDTRIRDPKGPSAPNPNSPDNNPPAYFGIQKINPGLNSYTEAVFGAYGPIRARLNPWSGEDHGDYLHGQYNGNGYTHGCLCYGTDTELINNIWNMTPQRIPVAVDVPVEEPPQ